MSMISKSDQVNSQMTLDQLIALDAIVAMGTFRAAAERLNKAQSAISHQIRKLEAELGFDLFSRDGYRPSLTTEGEVFYRETARVLEQVNGLKSVAASLRSEQESMISVVMTATMSLDPILTVLGDIGRRFPATHIRVATEMMGGPLARLMEGDADLIISGLAGVPLEEVETLPVDTIIIRPVASPSFPAAQRVGIRSRREMQTYTQVIVSGTGGQDFDQSRDLLSGGQRWTVSDFEAKKSVIKAGLGWGGIPVHLMQQELANGELVQLTVEGYPPRHTEIFAIRRRDMPMGQVMSRLWDDLKQARQSMPEPDSNRWKS
ncbi:LysR family transcriptional regulator [Phaeobacter gallaeciensis]|uniref:LysR family transcriptional regulator n=1 Tax=Phaeobacter gallaeciensis TaxID=60890 RepID=UPI000BC053CF|nr:Transcriptional regulator [Phaeobacter gallaeciensis]ATF24404.1 Transcriptional regulator [Phaeobacter gallaeciensis]